MEYKAVSDEDFQRLKQQYPGRSKWSGVYRALKEMDERIFIDELPENLRMALRAHYRYTHKVQWVAVDGGYVVWLEPIQGGTDGV